MIIIKSEKICFVHIPKCGGTTIRKMLSPIADAYMSEEEKKQFEKIHSDIAHWPLSLIEKHTAHLYNAILNYTSYAIVRDPYERFISSFSQRMGMFYKKQLRDMQKEEIKEGLQHVITYLTTNSGCHAILNPEYIHFQRQTDYIFNHQKQIIKHVYPLEKIDELINTLTQKIGNNRISCEKNHLNKINSYSNNSMKVLSKIIRSNKLYKIIPKKTRVAFKEKFVFKKFDPNTIYFLNSSYVKDFISEYYKTDIEFYKSRR